MENAVRISKLTQQDLLTRLSELRSLDSDLLWMSWSDESYLLDLPGKWDFSKLAERNGDAVGYALCSVKSNSLWLHRLVIGGNNRGAGVGADVLRSIEQTARENEFPFVRLKTPSDNLASRRFYFANGYIELSDEDGYTYLEKKMSEKIVGIHQPNFIPWLGYFYKISRSDVFIILDDVMAPSRGYFNRAKALVQGAEKWLSVPVHRNDGLINHMSLSGQDWIPKHLNTLKHSYQRSPFYEPLIGEYSDILYAHAESPLSELNEALIHHVASLLKISTPTVRSSEYEVNSTGDERLVELVEKVGGSCYLSGRGGDNYQSQDTFSAADISLIYTGFHNSPYVQQKVNEFVPGLSVLDALFNIGPGSTRQLIDDALDPLGALRD